MLENVLYFWYYLINYSSFKVWAVQDIIYFIHKLRIYIQLFFKTYLENLLGYIKSRLDLLS